MRIGVKLTVIMIALSLFSIATVGLTLLVRSRGEIGSLANAYALASARESAAELGKFLEFYWYKAETAAQMMEQYEHIFESNRRSFITSELHAMVEENTDIFGVWCIWNKDVLEGGDQRYLKTEGANETGRFAPYWYRTSSGLEQEALDENEVANPQGPFQMISKRGRGAVSDPYTYKIQGEEILMTTMAVPINGKNGRIVGIIGIDITLEKIQEISKLNKPFDSDIFAVFSNNGTIISHFDLSRIGKNMRETERDMAGPYFDDFLESINKGQEFFYSIHADPLDTDLNVFSVPITIGTSQTPWNYAVAIMSTVVLAPVYKMRMLTVTIGIVILSIAALAAIWLSRSFSKPIVNVTNALKDISQGEGDLTHSIVVHSRDEIGSMAHYFNLTLGKIKEMISVIKRQAAYLFDTGNELAGNMTETTAAINQITVNIQNIKGRVINQSASVTETNATMDQFTVNINKLNQLVENQSSDITQASSAIEEMIANIQSVTATLGNNAGNVKNLREASEAGRVGLQEVSGDIQEIARESEGLLGINRIMEDIASQTNLLSMNAAIEAAHAGDAGKGFAVVADEIRKLAENSSEQSRTTGIVLKKIQDCIDKITQATENALTKFEAIDLNVRTVAEQEEIIHESMKEQNTGSQQILEGVSNMNTITRQVKSGSNEMLEGANEVIAESTNLEKATQEITQSMTEMATGAEQIHTAVNRANEISEQNRENINLLVREVSRFKVE